uniref:Protein G12 n=1 Tax=Timema cristinae TaxID=61476 RepID=A0A7R9DDA4_TIMCR|nr:unnamed protein product [Timema cristinae]
MEREKGERAVVVGSPSRRSGLANALVVLSCSTAEDGEIEVRISMKIVFAFLAILGLSFAASVPVKSTRTLNDDLQDFIALIPVDQIEAIALDYISNDAEVQAVLEYLQSDDFRAIVEEVNASQEAIDLYDYLYKSGIDIYTFVNNINDLLGLPHVEPKTRSLPSKRTFRAFLDEVEAVLPIDDLIALFKEKQQSSPDFAAFVDRISSPEFHTFVDNIYNSDGIKDLIVRFKSLGVDVDRIIKIAKELLGWEPPIPQLTQPRFEPRSPRPQQSGSTRQALKSTRTLNDDFQDFIDIIPIDQIKAIFLDYLNNDAEVQDAMNYLQSDAFRAIIEKVNAAKETIDFYDYLYKSGVDIYTIINNINDFFGLPHVEPKTRSLPSKRTVRELLNKIEEILPIDDLLALFKEKQENSPEFAAFVKKISGPEFHAFVDRMYNSEEFQAMIVKMESYGVDVDKVIKLVQTMMGWESNE